MQVFFVHVISFKHVAYCFSGCLVICLHCDCLCSFTHDDQRDLAEISTGGINWSFVLFCHFVIILDHQSINC